MKLDVLEDGYLFFTNKIYSMDTEEDISLFLKDVFLSISDIYLIDLFGYFKLDIYIDDKIGVFVEIRKLSDCLSYSKKIDTKISIYKDHFYFKTCDLSYIYKYKKIYTDNKYYYISTKDVDNVLELFDFCDVEYRNFGLRPIFI